MKKFKRWSDLSDEEKLGCIKEGPPSNRFNNMSAWEPEADGCLEETWNETIYDLVINDMNKAYKSSEKVFPILRLLSPTGMRKDASPCLILVYPTKKPKQIISLLNDNRAFQRYEIRVTAEKSRVRFTGGSESPKVDPENRHRISRPSPSTSPRTRHDDLSRTTDDLEDLRYISFRSAFRRNESSITQYQSSDRGSYGSTQLHIGSQHDETGRGYFDYTVSKESGYAKQSSVSWPIRNMSIPGLPHTANNSACGISISVRPSTANGLDPYRVATVGGIFELRPHRFFALTAAHIFTGSAIVGESSQEESSDEESDVASPRGSPGDDQTSNTGRSSSSSSPRAQANGQIPEEHIVFAGTSGNGTKIGVAFSTRQLKEFSADYLYNLTLDWALFEITNSEMLSTRTSQTSGRTIKPRAGPQRTKPPSGDVLVLSHDQDPQRCRSIGAKSAINPDWAGGFIEAWTITRKSGRYLVY